MRASSRSRAKADQRSVAYATAGVGSGSHLSTELFAAMADIKLTHVPYRGTGAMQGDLAGGHVDMSITTFPSVFGQLRSGGLRPIAVTGRNSLADLVRSADDRRGGRSGLRRRDPLRYGRAGRAASLLRPERLNAALRAALANEDVRSRIAEEGGEPLSGTLEQQAADIVAEQAKWGALVRQLGMRE